MIKRILIPVDFSKPSLQALEYAIELGRSFKPEFVVLHVVEPIYYPVSDMYGPSYDMTMVYRELERAGREQLSRLAAKLQQKRVTTRTLLCVGTPYQIIVETAKKLRADLLIMSTHGRTGLSHALMGSVAEKVVRSAPCPVLTLRSHKVRQRAAPRRSGRTTRRSPSTLRSRSR